jgi:hypothetical protein
MFLHTHFFPERVGKRFFVAESSTKTQFARTAQATAMAECCEAVPGTIIGSIVIDSFVKVELRDATPELAAQVCLTIEGLRKAITRGYRYIWKVKNARKFKKKIKAASIYRNRANVVWSNTNTPPKCRMPISEDVIDRMILLLET